MANFIRLKTFGIRSRTPYSRTIASLAGVAMLSATGAPAFARPGGSAFPGFTAGDLVVSRIQYDGPSTPDGGYPYIFNDSSVTGIQGSIHLDEYTTAPSSPLVASLALPESSTQNLGSITTSFSSKSEGALTLSANGEFLNYMGYQAADELQGVSNSYTTGAGTNLVPPVVPAYDRDIAMIGADGTVTLQNESNANSGDNPRAVLTVDGKQFYMAGNSDSTLYNNSSKTPCVYSAGTTGPGLTIGARIGTPGSNTSTQLGCYFATDRPDESAKQHVKDNNWRGLGIFNGNLYVSKGSGGNGDDGLFQVQNGSGNGLPTGSGNTIVELFGYPATDPITEKPAPITPFAFFFVNPTTVYVADEGSSGNPDEVPGLQKWELISGTWTLLYTIQNGLDIGVAENVPGYPVPTTTTGLRNLTGIVNQNGTVTIYAITAQSSSISGGEPDPDRLVTVTDPIDANTLPASDSFVTLQESGARQVFRGVAFAPCGFGATTVNGNLNIPAGGRCALNGTTVTGSLTVNGALVANGATIRGNILAQFADFVTLNDATIGGNVSVGNLLGNPPASGENSICDSRISGNLQIRLSSADSPWDIGQPLDPPTGQAAGLCSAGNLVKANVQFLSNDAQGLISNNSIRGNLQCENDSPPASGIPGSNSVGASKVGECSGL
jgi:hypothetical protein